MRVARQPSGPLPLLERGVDVVAVSVHICAAEMRLVVRLGGLICTLYSVSVLYPYSISISVLLLCIRNSVSVSTYIRMSAEAIYNKTGGTVDFSTAERDVSLMEKLADKGQELGTSVPIQDGSGSSSSSSARPRGTAARGAWPPPASAVVHQMGGDGCWGVDEVPLHCTNTPYEYHQLDYLPSVCASSIRMW